MSYASYIQLTEINNFQIINCLSIVNIFGSYTLFMELYKLHIIFVYIIWLYDVFYSLVDIY